MLQAVLLDTGTLGLATKRKGISEAEACRAWIESLRVAGVGLLVPEIADYEVRRELLRTGNVAAIGRLDSFLIPPGRFLPITTSAMRLAAELWVRARNSGSATADRHAIDGDVILAAQALTVGFPADEIVVATANVRHLSRYVAADQWQKITP